MDAKRGRVHAVAPMEKRVLIEDVARRAGVHASTVSRALRDDPRIRPEVRRRLREIAGEMGYAPDPHLRALAKYRAKGRPADYRGVLGWLTNFPTRDGWRRREKIGYFAGASRRAKELGYDLEVFWLREAGIDGGRLRRILLARGIRGVLLPPQPSAGTRLDLGLDGLSAVSFGHTLEAPRLHVVHHHHYRSMRLLLSELQKLGYRRPGLALMAAVSRSVEGAWAAAYRDFTDGAAPAPLIEEALSGDRLLDWARRERPDVVISDEGRALGWLRRGGVRVPEDCGFALTARHPGHPRCAGIDENSEVVGATAVEQLTSLVERGETGAPAHPIDVLIEGAFQTPGNTVRPRD